MYLTPDEYNNVNSLITDAYNKIQTLKDKITLNDNLATDKDRRYLELLYATKADNEQKLFEYFQALEDQIEAKKYLRFTIDDYKECITWLEPIVIKSSKDFKNLIFYLEYVASTYLEYINNIDEAIKHYQKIPLYVSQYKAQLDEFKQSDLITKYQLKGAKALNHIGELYCQHKDWLNAEIYTKRAIILLSQAKQNDKTYRILALYYRNLGYYWNAQFNYEKAKPYYQSAIKHLKKINDITAKDKNDILIYMLSIVKINTLLKTSNNSTKLLGNSLSQAINSSNNHKTQSTPTASSSKIIFQPAPTPK